MKLELTQKCFIRSITKLKSLCLTRRDDLTNSMAYTFNLYKETGLKLHKERYQFYSDTRDLNTGLILKIDMILNPIKNKVPIYKHKDKYGKDYETYA